MPLLPISEAVHCNRSRSALQPSTQCTASLHAAYCIRPRKYVQPSTQVRTSEIGFLTEQRLKICRYEKKKEPTTGWVTLCLTPLGYPDSNQERQDQNLQCYHYTIAQEEKRRHPEDTHAKTKKEVGLPGLEPGKAGPESAVLPLHHSPIKPHLLLIAMQRYRVFSVAANLSAKKN